MRRILYVDGFNFFYGVHNNAGDRKGLVWCDFRALIERNFPDNGTLEIKYFTAPVTEGVELSRKRPGEHERYDLWMRALQTIQGVKVVPGYYKPVIREYHDGPEVTGRYEKQSDVNLAVEMVIDSFGPEERRPQQVLLLSGDHDLMPAVLAVHERAPSPISVIVLLPPSTNAGAWHRAYERTRGAIGEGHSVDRAAVPGNRIELQVLDEEMLTRGLMRYELRDEMGTFHCPEYWTLPATYLDMMCDKPEWRPDVPATGA